MGKWGRLSHFYSSSKYSKIRVKLINLMIFWDVYYLLKLEESN